MVYTLREVNRKSFTHLFVNKTHTTKREYLLLAYIKNELSKVNTKNTCIKENPQPIIY